MSVCCISSIFLTPLRWLRAVLLILNSFFVAAIHSLVLLPIYPLWFVLPNLYVTIECFLYSKCGEALIPAFTIFPKLRLHTDTMSVLEPLTRKKAMVMVNHQDSGDVPVMMCLLSYFSISHTTSWILDRMFRWTQFGIPSQWHNDFFSQEGSKEVVANALKKHYSTTFFDRGQKWLVFFPEGGYVKNRGARSREFAKKNDLPQLYNCCLPRATAFVNIIQAFRGDVVPLTDPVEEVMDVTIAYKGPRDFCLQDLFFGTYQNTDIYMNFRTFKLAEVPQGEEEMTKWLYDRYVEKEELLKNFKENGEFVEGATFTQLHQSPGYLLGSLSFWYISAFFVWDFYSSILTRLLGATGIM